MNGILNRGWVGNTAAEAGNNGEELENKNRGFYLPKDYIRMGYWGMAKNFLQLFSPEAKWCCPEAKGWCPEGKSIEFFFSNEERSSSERKKTQWTFLKDTILLLKDNIILLKEKTNGKSFLPSRSSSSLYNHEANNINWFYFSILSIISHP